MKSSTLSLLLGLSALLSLAGFLWSLLLPLSRADEQDAGVENTAGVSEQAKWAQDAAALKAETAKAAAGRLTVFLQRLNGKLETLSPDDLARQCHDCQRYGSIYYESVAQANLEQVNACAWRSRGRSGVVNEDRPALCKSRFFFDKYHSGKTKYFIYNNAGKIHVAYNLRLKFPQKFLGDAITDGILDETRACAEQIHQFWGRYGLSLRIEVDSERSPRGKPDRSVNVFFSEGRSDAGSFYWFARPGGAEADRKNNYCLMMLHETGHHLGFDDEYLDPGCPGRKYTASERYPFSVMDNQDYGWRNIEFFSRHLAQLLEPICGF